jgi:DNA repair exonuclease SbcCD ATPase subunit
MKHIHALALLVVFGVLPVFGQAAPQTDSQTLQALLAEVRALHNDVRLGQASQILLTELGLQQTQVNRAVQKRDDSKAKLSQAQTTRKQVADMVTILEDHPETVADAARKDEIAQMQTNYKSQLGALKSMEDDASNSLQDAETALRKEQETLGNIQAQLDAVMKQLQPAARP